jgi:ElaB/YqjD/DUF883 family membrane-anchored ribosome-binding protein
MSRHSHPKTLSEAIEQLEKASQSGFSSQLEELKHLLEELKPQLDEAFQSTSEKIKSSTQAIEEKPFAAVGIAALIGLVLGFLLGRGGRR